MRLPVRYALLALVMAGAIPSSAQRVSVAARDTAAIVAAPAATISTALRITNGTAKRVALVPSITIPADWSAPVGAMPFALAAGETDSWIVSVRIPARAPAGRYVIGLSAKDSAGNVVVRDSLAVDVSVVRGLDLSPTNRPTYAVSGDTYRAAFLLKNRGNVRTTVMLRGTSLLDGSIALDSTQMTLAAGASLPLVVRVATRTKGLQAEDDVLELYVSDKSDTSVTAFASTRVLIVQKANASEPLHRVASQLRLRAANASAGVSPYELIGNGLLREGGSEQLAFVLRGSPGKASQFGDQDEYRVELKGANYTARAGDALYRASSLSSSGQMGFGGGVDVQEGALGAGAFAQRFRFQPDSPVERGAYVSARASDMFAEPQLTVSGLTRTGGAYAGQILGTGVTLSPPGKTNVELEVAASNGPLGRGAATTVHFSGGDRVHYDIGHIAADDRFAGITRGADHDYASLSARATSDLQFTASVGSHLVSGASLGLIAPQYFRSSTVAMEYATRYSLQYSAQTRTSSFASFRNDELQRGLLARAEQTVGAMRFWGGAGAGIASSGLADRHGYHELSLGASAEVGVNSLSLYGETSKGMSMTRGADGIVTLGGDGRLQLGPSTHITFNGFQTSILSTGERFSQLDAGLSQSLPTGSTVSLRVRVAGTANDARGREVAFIEYSMPLQMPVGRTRSAGRVRGRVVDQETGRGIAGTLVRLGPQAAITDDEGRVAFAGLPAGEYRLSLAQQTAQAATVFTGDPTVRVDSARRVPTTFALALERAGIVEGTVRHMSVARTGLENAPDSLADAGPLNDVPLMLVGVRDTLYTTTDETGSYRFAEVASGSYMLKVMSEPHAGTRWEPAEIEVSVKPAVTRQIAFRSVPRRRAVQMIGGEVIVVPPKMPK